MPRLFAIALLLPGIVLGSAAAAQDGADPYADCAAISGDAERLTCFDETYARSHPSRDEVERLLAERREDEFGFTPEDRAALREREAAVDPGSAARLAREQEEEERRETINAKIDAVSVDGDGRRTVQLDNGQVWRERNGSRMFHRVRDGWTATVSRHWSGAYEMRFEERSGYLRVMRVR